MGVSIVITVVVTVLAILAIQKRFKPGIAIDEESQPDARFQRNYRDQIFADIIKINSMTLANGKLDALTELPDYQIFEARLKLIANHSRQFSQIFTIMVVSIDNLNAVNQAHGEKAGNELIIEVTKRLQITLRQIDTISRYAGNIFYLILPDLSNSDFVLHVAQRMQDALLEPAIINNTRINLQCSIGAALYSTEDSTDKVIQQAKEALNNAKLIGENKYYLYKKDVDNVIQEQQVAKYISDNKIDEIFMLYYQPYIDVNIQKISVLQASAYLKHPYYGMISYEQFYHALEISGKLSEFGEWQLKKVIAQINQWKMDGNGDQHVIIKMSLRELENRRHLQQIAEIIDRVGNINELIIVEIDKGNVKTYQKSVNEIMEILESRKIKLAISLMELGRMNISNISDLPFHYLKIDNQLVKTIAGKNDNDLIIQSLLAGIDQVTVIVLADGVDLPDQKEKLVQAGCSIMKGQMFLPAGPGEETFVPQEQET